jgi:hypothetical protein
MPPRYFVFLKKTSKTYLSCFGFFLWASDGKTRVGAWQRVLAGLLLRLPVVTSPRHACAREPMRVGYGMGCLDITRNRRNFRIRAGLRAHAKLRLDV